MANCRTEILVNGNMFLETVGRLAKSVPPAEYLPLPGTGPGVPLAIEQGGGLINIFAVNRNGDVGQFTGRTRTVGSPVP